MFWNMRGLLWQGFGSYVVHPAGVEVGERKIGRGWEAPNRISPPRRMMLGITQGQPLGWEGAGAGGGRYVLKVHDHF